MSHTSLERLTAGCTCGNCTPGCSTRLFFPCCGACMNDSEPRTCEQCNGDGAIYEQVRVGQFSTPFVCPTCNGDGELP